MVKNCLLHFLILFIFFGCAIKSRSTQKNIRKLLNQKNFSGALSLLESSELKKKEKHQLLYLMERGTLEFYQELYIQSAKTFEEANSLVDKLYTKSITKIVASSIINENSDVFYGAIFERSLIFYYQALSFHKLYSLGKSKITTKDKDNNPQIELKKLSKQEIMLFKQSTRSSLIAWDSFYQEVGRIKNNNSILKASLIAKRIAAFLHQSLGTRRDFEIALQLNKDAKKIMEKFGPSRKIFNPAFKKYSKKLKNSLKNNLRGKLSFKLNSNSEYKRSLDQINYDILNLTKKLRPYNFNKLVKKLNLSRSSAKRVISKKKIKIMVESGSIKAVTPEDFTLNLRSAISNIEDPSTKALVEGIGVPVLTYFALGPLGLGYYSRSKNVTIYSQNSAGMELTKEVGIEFELPKVKEHSYSFTYILNIYSNSELVKSLPLVAVDSLHDNSFINNQEAIQQSYNKRATRIGIKYALAIAAAYSTYKTMKDSNSEVFAKPAAFAQYVLSTKAIRESEKADLRHWSSLPGIIWEADIDLEPGSYSLELLKTNIKTKEIFKKNLGELDYTGQENALFSYRSF